MPAPNSPAEASRDRKRDQGAARQEPQGRVHHARRNQPGFTDTGTATSSIRERCSSFQYGRVGSCVNRRPPGRRGKAGRVVPQARRASARRTHPPPREGHDDPQGIVALADLDSGFPPSAAPVEEPPRRGDKDAPTVTVRGQKPERVSRRRRQGLARSSLCRDACRPARRRPAHESIEEPRAQDLCEPDGGRSVFDPAPVRVDSQELPDRPAVAQPHRAQRFVGAWIAYFRRPRRPSQPLALSFARVRAEATAWPRSKTSRSDAERPAR